MTSHIDEAGCQSYSLLRSAATSNKRLLVHLHVTDHDSNDSNEHDNQGRISSSRLLLLFGIGLHLGKRRRIHFEGSNEVLGEFLSGLLGMSNVLKEFVSVGPGDIEHDFGAAGVIVEVFGHVVYLGASWNNERERL